MKPNLKVVVWKIPDVKGKGSDEAVIKKDILKIMKKIDKLVEGLR